MADNVAVTQGSGTTFAADDISSVFYPRAKLSLGADGTAVDAVAGAGANGTGVQRITVATDDALNTALGATTDAAVSTDANGSINAHIRGLIVALLATNAQLPTALGSTTGSASLSVVQPSDYGLMVTKTTDITRPADTTAYAAGDNLSDSTSAPTSGGFTLTGVARASGKSGVISDVMVISSNPAGGFSGEVWLFDSSVTNINDNAAFAISDAEAKTVVGKVSFLTVADTNNSCDHAQNVNIGFTTSGSANLRYLIRVKAAYTPISAEVITVRAKCLQVD